MRFVCQSLLCGILIFLSRAPLFGQGVDLISAKKKIIEASLSFQHLVFQNNIFQNQISIDGTPFRHNAAILKKHSSLNDRNETFCGDTSARFFLKDPNGGSFYIGDYIRAKNGHLLIAGQYVKSNGGKFISKGFLMEADEKGQVFWNRIFQYENAADNDFIFYYKLLQLANGNVLLAGSTLDYVTQNNDLILTETDGNGNFLWSKIYVSRLWAHGNQSSNYYNVKGMIEDEVSGDVFIAGQHWTEGRSVIDVDPSTGKIKWSNLYQPFDGGNFDDPFGMDLQKDQLLLFGNFLTADGACVSIYRLDKSTGDTISSRFYKIEGNNSKKNGFVVINPLVKLDNGNYVLTGQQYGYNSVPGDTLAPYHAGYIEFDKKLDFVKAFSFRNPIKGNSSNTMITVFPDGSGLFTILDYVSSFTSPVYFVQFQNDKILHQRVKLYSGESVPNQHPAIESNDGGTLSLKLIADSASATTGVEFLKLHTTDSASQCLGFDDHSTFIEHFTMENVPGKIDSVGVNVFREGTNKNLTVSTAQLVYSPGCSQISFCDSLSLFPAAASICNGDSLDLSVHKNPACAAPVIFMLDSSKLESVSGINDSLYRFKFSSSWQGTIYAILKGCAAVRDSVVITSPAIHFTNDTGFCPGGNVALDAGAGFSSYQWNTGSDQQIITVSSEGNYSVKASTVEGCAVFDTINVKQYESAVPTLNKNPNLCSGQPRILDAGNFVSFHWNTGDSTRTISINDLGIYSVAIKDINGCTATDSVNIKYIVSLPSEFLPADTTFCNNKPALLEPIKNYNSYLWSNGDETKSISVSQAGTYWLQVTDENNCLGTDSIILNDGDCADGFFIPNAFTPNNDGRNDHFKPFLFGSVEHYQFEVYNREGQLVFKSYNQEEGWDGTFKNLPEDSNLFVWICRYRFKGKEDKTQRGTVMLIR